MRRPYGHSVSHSGDNMKKLAGIFLFPLILGIGFGQDTVTARDVDPGDPRVVIEKVRMQRLVKELELTDEQEAELFPVLDSMRAVDERFHAERQAVIHDIRDLLSDNAPDEVLIRALTRYDDITRGRFELQMVLLDKIRSVLTPLQRARFVIFQEEFDREIREMIREVKRLRPR